LCNTTNDPIVLVIRPKLVQACWQLSLNLWYGRNAFIHGEESPKATRQTVRLNNKIKEAYKNQSLLGNSDDIYLLFAKNLNDMLELSDERKLNWLLLYDSCLHAPTFELRSRRKHHHSTISLYLFNPRILKHNKIATTLRQIYLPHQQIALPSKIQLSLNKQA